MSHTISASDVQQVAKLANIPIDDSHIDALTQAFKKTIEVVDQLNTLPTANIEPTSQVTGLENVWREDVVDEKRMFTQEEALKNAPRQYNGFFVVHAVFEEE